MYPSPPSSPGVPVQAVESAETIQNPDDRITDDLELDKVNSTQAQDCVEYS